MSEKCIPIVAREIVPYDLNLARKVMERYVERTRSHIASVREFGAKALPLLSGEDWCCLLKVNLMRHDHDKLDDPVFMAHYAPYIVKRYCDDGLSDMFSLADGYAKLWDEKYVVQHCLKNGHHPEHWDESYGYGENRPPYEVSSMPPEFLAEMCCDWCAVGREKGNTAMEWFQKVNGARFLFSDRQQAFIEWLLRRLE